MACHVAGVKTAVATCGTAFGDDHARVIRRLLQDHDEFRGEVIFTFDGDEAGQKAALRAFEGDQIFAGQTYVAVEPGGLDPCDVRLQQGDAEVRELVARRVPLYRFVLANVVQRYDLDRADGRIDAMREAAKLVTSIRDRSKVDAFSRELAGMIGISPPTSAGGTPGGRARHPRPGGRWPRSGTPAAPPRPAGPARPGPGRSSRRDPATRAARPARPAAVPRARDPQAGGAVPAGGRPHGARRRRRRLRPGAYRALWASVEAAGGPSAADAHVGLAVARRQTDDLMRSLVSVLAVEPLHSAKAPDDSYVGQHVFRLQELTAMRRIADVKSRLQRTNPVEHAAEYNRMFGELVALEQTRRSLRERALESQ